MKKNLFAFAAACMIAACGAASANAQELAKDATAEQIAAYEAETGEKGWLCHRLSAPGGTGAGVSLRFQEQAAGE